ncbi:MAG: LytTR family transcriptional regulator DNA-binding domain-containing protein [Lachnospiraceae bacterium]|nr:LytTR family transcriptional regulator DNA-binding domain-containing protein [Lachnospiraceae bacterium]
MIRLRLFQDEKQTEEHIDIYYSEMKPVIRKIIDMVHQEKPVLEGTIEGEKKFLQVESIYYMDTVDKRVYAYTEDKVYQLHHSLAQLEEMLWDYGYIRINKSNLVNIFRIQNIKPEANMRVGATFDNGEKLYINRSYKKRFQEYLVKMKGVVGNEKSIKE